MKFMKLKYYLAPIFIKEVNNISEKYINLIKEIQETNNYEKTLEFNELRNSITLRIEEIDKFFEQNFDKPFIFNFEKGRIRLKKLLMYEPELFNKFDNGKNINGMAFGQTISNNNDINNNSQNYENYVMTNNNNNNNINKNESTLNEDKISLSSKRNFNKSVEKDFNNNNNNNNNNKNNLTTRFKEKNLNLYENYNNFNKKKKNNKIFNNKSININNEKNNENFNNSITFNKSNNRNNSYDKKSNIKYYNLNDSNNNNNNNNLNKKQLKKFLSKKLNVKNNKNEDNNNIKDEQNNNNKNDKNSKKNISSVLREKKEILIKFKLTEEEYKHLLKLKALYINQ